MRTLWSKGGAGGADESGQIDPRVLAWTVGDDRLWDARLLPWDVVGSLGHVRALAASRLVSPAEAARLERGLRGALRAVLDGALTIGPEFEDAHSAIEFWLTTRLGRVAEKLHTGRSRNDQIALDLRLFAKTRLLALLHETLALIETLLAFARQHRRVIWPGYTHQRRAMPSSAALWAASYAETLADTLLAFEGLWRQVDRCPLGSAAGYGTPLPLDRRASARALGFADSIGPVAAVQLTRGKLEAALLGFGLQLAHDIARISADVILFSSDEFGWLRLPPQLATGSSLMPHKRNPDLFELARGRAAALSGDHAAALALAQNLPSGYHRDFQLLKEPLIRGLDRAAEALAMVRFGVSHLSVDAGRARAALDSSLFATDAALALAAMGVPFRSAYRQVGERYRRGESFVVPSVREVLQRRGGEGGLGAIDLLAIARRVRPVARFAARVERHFDAALVGLAGAALARRVRASSQAPGPP